MSDDSKAPTDLSTLGIDLSDIFRPAWTVESSDNTAKLAAKFDDGDRGERPGRSFGGERSGGGPRNRDGGRDGGRGSKDRDSRGPHPQSAGGNRDSRGGTPAGGIAASGGSARSRGPRDQNRDRDSRGPRREERRPEPVAKPMLQGWKIDLLPQPSALEAITKQIRSRAKAYPIFELARLIVNLSDRYSVKLTAESETSPELYCSKVDGSLWTSRKEAIAHILAKHLDKFYRRSSITTEAPKGNYSVVAQCGMSGILLGPPNHHEYQSRLLALHASRFKNLPFEVYKTRIKMMRDDALMEQWKTEQSTRTVFIPITKEASVAEEIIEEVLPTPATEESVEQAESAVAAPSDETVAESAETPAESTETVSDAEEVTPEAPSEELAPASSEETGPTLTFEEVTAHFNEHHVATEVTTVSKEIVVAGKVALHGSDSLLHEALIKTLQELDRFPLPLAQVLGKEFSSGGLQIYKAQKKIHVSVARPKYLDRSTTPTSEGFRKILDYLEAHPNQHRDKQWAGLLAQITQPEGDTPEILQQREKALGTDLLWLLHQGHVIDFAMGNLQAALKPAPKPTPNSAPVKTEKKDAGQDVAPQPAVEPCEEIALIEVVENEESVEAIEPISEETEAIEAIAIPEPAPEPLAEEAEVPHDMVVPVELEEKAVVETQVPEEPVIAEIADEATEKAEEISPEKPASPISPSGSVA